MDHRIEPVSGARQNGFKNGYSAKSELPVTAARQQIIRHIRSRPTSIIVSQTASGKTTEIPKMLYESGFCNKYSGHGAICITQPRRVAATTVARYVAKLMNCELGSLVGYSVRFDDATSSQTKIKYVTDGMLLRECLNDPLLLNYSVVILDEAHERTVNSDVLCSILKNIQTQRKLNRPLKLVIMSATVNPEVYVRFFSLSPDDLVFLRGRQHEVEINYVESKQDDFVQAALVTVLKLVRETERGDILVFGTGQEEIESMVRSCNEAVAALGHDVKAFPLYSALSKGAQERAITPQVGDRRKVIFATNIAETSITIPGVRYVVDACRMKCRYFNHVSGWEALRVEKISQAQAWQRSGRAGRVSNGECFRLLTAEEFAELDAFPIAEIRRCSLANVVMNILALRLDIRTFEWLESPAEEAVKRALQTLDMLEATEVEEDGLIVLSRLGTQMRRFPLEPTYSRCVFGAKTMSCVEPMLTIIAMLSSDGSPFIGRADDGGSVGIRQFGTNEGDLIMYLDVYTKFNQANGNKEWCDANGINRKTLANVKNIREQLRNVCGQLSISLSKSNSENIRKALVTGLFRNVAIRSKEKEYVAMESKLECFIHPSSCLFRQSPEVVVFTEIVKTSKRYMRNVTPIDPDWYDRLVPKEYRQKFALPKRFLQNS